jgi:hypothetical protein|tara:strand:+ start:520 stop:1086 length:567 start_codon:yes stop_codon:yes gene_type:complete
MNKKMISFLRGYKIYIILVFCCGCSGPGGADEDSGGYVLDNTTYNNIDIPSVDVRNYYKNNVAAFKREKNCARIFVVILKTENDANRVASTLRRGGRKEHFILSQNNLSWVGVAKEGDLMLQLNDAVFNRRKGVVGPIKTEIGFLVAHILGFYPEGSVVGVDEVYDKIFSMLYLEKRREKYKTIIEED